MSRSCVNIADPCTVAATPPTTTKSTLPSVRRRSSERGLNLCSSCTLRLDDLVPERLHVLVPRFESLEPFVGRQPQRAVQQRLVDARLARDHPQVERSAHRVEGALERGDRYLVAGGLESRDRRLRHAEPTRQRRLGQAFCPTCLADQCAGSHKPEHISIKEHLLTTARPA